MDSTNLPLKIILTSLYARQLSRGTALTVYYNRTCLTIVEPGDIIICQVSVKDKGYTTPTLLYARIIYIAQVNPGDPDNGYVKLTLQLIEEVRSL